MPSADVEKSLREDIERHIAGRLGGLQEEVARLRGQLTEALDRLAAMAEEAARPGW